MIRDIFKRLGTILGIGDLGGGLRDIRRSNCLQWIAIIGAFLGVLLVVNTQSGLTDALRRDVAALKDEAAGWTVETDDLKKDVADLVDVSGDFKKSIDELRNESVTAQNEIERLQRAFTASQDKVDSLIAHIAALEGIITTIEVCAVLVVIILAASFVYKLIN